MSFNFINPFAYVNNPANSNPVGLGKMYIGLPDTDPITPANQIPVYAVQPNGSELQIPQPVRTTAGGVATYNGTPVQLKLNADSYSVRIDSSTDAQLYYTARAYRPDFAIVEALADGTADVGGSTSALVGLSAENQTIVTPIAENSGVDLANKALTRLVANANVDSWVMLLGDSHGWGEGAPEYDPISGVSNLSVHSSPLFQKGFYQRLMEYYYQKRGWGNYVYSSVSSVVGSKITGDQLQTSAEINGNKIRPYTYVCGGLYPVTTSTELYASRVRALDSFYSPDVKLDSYSQTAYRDKLNLGLIPFGLTVLKHETDNDFSVDNKKYFYEFPVNPTYPDLGAGFTLAQGPGGSTLAFRETATGAVSIVSKPNLQRPIWLTPDALVYLRGYGLIKIAAQTDSTMVVTDADNSVPDISIMKCFGSPIKVYPGSYLIRALLSVDFDYGARCFYIAVRQTVNTGVMRLFFTDSNQIGVKADPYITSQPLRLTPSDYSTRLPGGSLITTLNQNGGIDPTSSPEVTYTSTYIDIDTNSATSKEVIYRIDMGGRVAGRLFIENLDPTKQIEIRGVVVNNNKAVNLSMGGHTVAAWLGNQESFSAETRDHVADWLNYTPVRPYAVVVQIPFVNEYLKQNSIASFTSSLTQLVSRFNSHLPTSNLPANVGVQFVFFTPLRNKQIAFEGGASNPVTYDMYVAAAKSFAETNGHVWIDAEQKLFDLVDRGYVDYERLYSNSNHPSDYANDVIFDVLKQYLGPVL